MVNRIRLTAAAVVLSAAVAVVGAAPSASAAVAPADEVTGAAIAGVGHFTLHGPDVEGHKIRFSVQAWAGPNDATVGSFGFRHLLADGELLSVGRADVTCLRVSDGVAIFSAVVTSEYIPPTPPGLPLGPHGFYLKVTDDRPDQIAFAQAIDPPGPLETDCFDVEERYPDYVERYRLDRGDFVLHG